MTQDTKTAPGARPLPVLMSRENPEGWKLEDLLAQLIVEMEAKTLRIAEDTREHAQCVTWNNRMVLFQLGGALRAQRSSIDILAAVAPDPGPLGTPRIGVGSDPLAHH